MSSFYSTAHEIGHSLYERGLNKDLFGTPLGEAATAGVHESQSLFWENRVAEVPNLSITGPGILRLRIQATG